MSEPDLVRTSIRLPKSVHAQLKWTAVNRGKSLEAVVQLAVEREIGLQAASVGKISLGDATLLRGILESLEPSLVAIRTALESQPPEPEALLSKYATAILDYLPFPAAIKDWATCRIIWCNWAYAALLGKTVPEVLEHTLQEILKLPDDDPTVVHAKHVTGEAFEHVCVNGMDVDVMALRFLFDEPTGAHYTGDLSFSRSLRDQARANPYITLSLPPVQRLEPDPNVSSPLHVRFLNELPTVALIKDPQGRIRWANRAFLTLVGCGSLSDVVGYTSAELFGPYTDSSITDYEARVLFDRVAVVGRESLAGAERIGIRFPILDDSGRIIFIGVVSTNRVHSAVLPVPQIHKEIL